MEDNKNQEQDAIDEDSSTESMGKSKYDIWNDNQHKQADFLEYVGRKYRTYEPKYSSDEEQKKIDREKLYGIRTIVEVAERYAKNQLHELMLMAQCESYDDPQGIYSVMMDEDDQMIDTQYQLAVSYDEAMKLAHKYDEKRKRLHTLFWRNYLERP